MSCHSRKPPFHRSQPCPGRPSSPDRRQARARPSKGSVFVSRLLIVDGHAYAYRAFYAIRELRSPSGQPTNAVYGFVKMLAKMRATLKPSHSIVVWDGGLSAERMTALPDYKA